MTFRELRRHAPFGSGSPCWGCAPPQVQVADTQAPHCRSAPGGLVCRQPRVLCQRRVPATPVSLGGVLRGRARLQQLVWLCSGEAQPSCSCVGPRRTPCPRGSGWGCWHMGAGGPTGGGDGHLPAGSTVLCLLPAWGWGASLCRASHPHFFLVPCRCRGTTGFPGGPAPSPGGRICPRCNHGHALSCLRSGDQGQSGQG